MATLSFEKCGNFCLRIWLIFADLLYSMLDETEPEMRGHQTISEHF